MERSSIRNGEDALVLQRMWKRLKYRCLAVSEGLTLERRGEKKGQKVERSVQKQKWTSAKKKKGAGVREKG